MKVQLRPYQLAARAECYRAWREEPDATRQPMVVIATGGGKTITGLSMVADCIDAGKRVLWLAHREELLNQPLAAFQGIWGEHASKAGIVQAGRDAADKQFVIASVDTLRNEERLCSVLEHGEPRLVVCDEAHHTMAKTWVDILNRMPNSLRLGLTATPERGDSKDLGSIWDIRFVYSMVRAIQDGYLVEPRHVLERLPKLNLDEVGGRDDYDDQELGDALLLAGVVEHSVEVMQKHGKGRHVLLFTATVEQAEKTSEALCEAGFRSRIVSGKTSKQERQQVVRGFERGLIDVICNVGVFTEGTDLPICDTVVLARPTRSKSLYIQCLSDDTEILTKSGWAGVDQVFEGDLVAGFNTADGSVEWVPALSKVVRPVADDEQMYEINNPALSIRVTGGHRMVYSTKAVEEWRFSSADSMPATARLPVCGLMGAPDIPLTDDEIRFIGWVYGDGCWCITPQVYRGKNGNRGYLHNHCAISQSEKYPDNLAKIESLLDRLNFSWRKRRHHPKTNAGLIERHPRWNYQISWGAPRRDKGKRGCAYLAGYMTDSKSSGLAEPLKNMSRRQLLIFMESLYASDGAKHASPSINWLPRTGTVAKGDKQLLDDLQALMVTRGVRANRSGERIGLLYYRVDKPWHQVRFAEASDSRPWCKPSPTKSGEIVWCVENRLSTLITRRNGKVVILGNCIGRGLRLYPEKEDALVIDIAGASNEHSLVQAPILLGEMEEDERKGCPESPVGKHDWQRTEAWVSKCSLCERTMVHDPLKKKRSVLNGLTARRERVKALWHPLRGLDRRGFVCDCGEHGMIFVLENIDGSGTWLPWIAAPKKRKPQPLSDIPVSLELAYGLGDDVVRRASALTAPKAMWRSGKMTDGQKNYMARLGIHLHEEVSKGEAAKLITMKKASERAVKLGIARRSR